MAKTKGLWQDKRTGILYLRRRVPDALKPAFACGDFYKVSLGTADPRDAEKRLAIANGEFEKKLETFRAAAANATGGHLTLDEAKSLIERHLTSRSADGFASGGMGVAFVLRALDESVAELEGTALPSAQSMSAEEWIAHRRAVSGSDTDDELSPETIARLEAEHAARHRPWGDEWFDYQRRVPRRRWRPLLDDAVAGLKRELKLEEGLVPGIDEPLAEALSQALQSPELRNQRPQAASLRRRKESSRARPDMKLAELCRLWNASRKPRPKSLDAAEKAVAYFTSYVGDIGIGEITANDCFEFRDAVAMLPNSMPRAHRALAFADLHLLYAGRTNLTRVSPQTIKKYLGSLQALLGFAFQEQFIPANPSAGIKVEGYTKASDRRPFTRDELAKLFGAPLLTQPWSKSRSRSSVSDSTLRWLFLIGLFSGGRIEELGQVLLADVKQEDGIWYLDVDDYVAPDAGEDTKSVKTESSVRVIPLHPRLIALGFIERVEALRKSGATKLFPDLKADRFEVQTKEASRRAGRVIDAAVSKDPRLVFHSFRHTFKDLCRDANIPVDVHDQLTGHAPATAGARYGLGRAIANLHRHLSRLKLPFIDWAAINQAAAA